MLTSFASRADLLRSQEIKIGDTSLLPQFLNYCSQFDAGRLFFTAPYYDENFLKRLGGKFLRSRVSFEIVVKSVEAALSFQNTLTGLAPVSTYVYENLHAKVYVFESQRRDLVALIGSHNPTVAGSEKNLEVGVYIGAKFRTPEWASIFELRAHLRNLARPFQVFQNER